MVSSYSVHSSSSIVSKGWKKLAGILDSDNENRSLDSQYGQLSDEEESENSKSVDVTIKGNNGCLKTVELEVGQDVECILEVQVPAGVKAGEPIMVRTPDGPMLRFRVPAGHEAGDTLFVPMPKKSQKGFMSWCKGSLRKAKSSP